MRQSVLLLRVLALLALLPLLTPFAASAQEATPVTACPSPSAGDNEDLVRQFLAAVSSGDDAAAAALAAEEITIHSRARGERLGNVESLFQGQQATFPEANMTIDLLVADGETVAAYVSWSGSLQGETAMIAGQEVNVPEGQRDAEWVGSVFFQLECGKITDVWPVIDRLGHLMDLGVITEDDLRSAGAATPAP